jgi:hypothetical protein
VRGWISAESVLRPVDVDGHPRNLSKTGPESGGVGRSIPFLATIGNLGRGPTPETRHSPAVSEPLGWIEPNQILLWKVAAVANTT